jgi:hypothetical protein
MDFVARGRVAAVGQMGRLPRVQWDGTHRQEGSQAAQAERGRLSETPGLREGRSHANQRLPERSRIAPNRAGSRRLSSCRSDPDVAGNLQAGGHRFDPGWLHRENRDRRQQHLGGRCTAENPVPRTRGHSWSALLPYQAITVVRARNHDCPGSSGATASCRQRAARSSATIRGWPSISSSSTTSNSSRPTIRASRRRPSGAKPQ